MSGILDKFIDLFGATPNRYPLPDFLEGICTRALYDKWLTAKAHTLFERDLKRGKPYALNASVSIYKEKIHAAVLAGGQRDPYTGEELRWDLISTWDTSHVQEEGYKKRFALMPTVDHVTPDTLDFVICSWQINDAKSDLSPEEFVALCKKVVDFRK